VLCGLRDTLVLANNDHATRAQVGFRHTAKRRISVERNLSGNNHQRPEMA
jgi:hypothetical protein